jgi:glyoxylase-like metal-dependent hydrolase (beta-lactamase superfamily II)
MPTAIDLRFQGQPRVIASAVLAADDGIALVDPGPASCLPALEAGLQALGYGLVDVRALLLTHIHLDHAGAAGTLAARLPGLAVHVHEKGAPHMADPTKLLASATRLYGADMERLWGEFLPVPRANLRVLSGGEVLTWRGRRIEVAYTPGHAVHHVSYLDTADGTAYVGDTAGIHVGYDYLLPPTPPPDIDVEVWEQSLDRLLAWSPVRLFLTHFGEVGPVPAHLERFRAALRRSAAMVREALAGPGDDAVKIAAFEAHLRADVRRVMPEEAARSTEMAAPFAQLWMGLARYWRKRGL